MFTYLMLGTNDLARAVRFYDPVMAALGHARCDTGNDASDDEAGWGTYLDDGRQELALWLCQPFNGQPASAGNGTMVALAARTRAQVDAFHAAALAQGGTNEGAPGLRPHYGPDFYAAYVRDPDGNKLAAVCRAAPSASGLGA
ncbi:Glyoxalase/bleomycin resistance protein/dioxygenase [Thiomonas sp. X19]|uniref:VOC family protein n=1 Tax=Thiomonas sp. X19 TaxID=1050370 RepID=UPI000B637905|nr:VOC family protein [Thiomonas sp. X19]SCC92894.1 Glyoxalase/bleomycin resistance protein/dioxygenase [Thiomonas sp. X19]